MLVVFFDEMYMHICVRVSVCEYACVLVGSLMQHTFTDMHSCKCLICICMYVCMFACCVLIWFFSTMCIRMCISMCSVQCAVFATVWMRLSVCHVNVYVHVQSICAFVRMYVYSLLLITVNLLLFAF